MYRAAHLVKLEINWRHPTLWVHCELLTVLRVAVNLGLFEELLLGVFDLHHLSLQALAVWTSLVKSQRDSERVRYSPRGKSGSQ